MNENKLGTLININKNDIITIVGAGGKTSLINYIAKLYKDKEKVLITTTTKIYLPLKTLYKEIYLLNKIDNINELYISKEKGITVIGKYVNEEKKIVGVDFKDLDNLTDKFDLVLIEGDGSKRKKLKGWNNTEPVVYKKSTKTLGVLDITSYNMNINEDNIHRLDKFKEITNCKRNKVSIDDLVNIVLNPSGLFKNACGKKTLFINKVEKKYYEKLTKELISRLNEYNHNIDIIYGSLIKEEFNRM